MCSEIGEIKVFIILLGLIDILCIYGHGFECHAVITSTAASICYFSISFFPLQFERDKKSKGNDGAHSAIGHTIGLDEVLSSLSTSEFLDEQVTFIKKTASVKI